MDAYGQNLRDMLLTLTPSARDTLRNVLIRHQCDRDWVAAQLLCHGNAKGNGWADVVDILTMYPDVRRKVVRLLAEVAATE